LIDFDQQILYKKKIANRMNLCMEEVDERPTIIHYSGHGGSDYIALEDDYGRLDPLSSESLGQIYDGNKKRIVFVSASSPELVGDIFTAAGYKHVIATNNITIDKNFKTFCRIFYLSLLVHNRTIQQSFDIAKNSVENGNFLLLPESENHDIVMFSDCRRGSYVDDKMNKLAYNGCDVVPSYFIGRNQEIQQIYSYFSEFNWVTIRGESGMGKSTLAARACDYMNDRMMFDAIYYVPLKILGASTSSSVNELAKMFGLCMDKASRSGMESSRSLDI
jgi:hypothetical protein